MGRHQTSASSLILNRIKNKGPGWVFTPSVFLDLGTRTAVGLALNRLKKDGTIRQLARGLYDNPRHDPQLGLMSPSTDAVADALRGRDAVRLQPTGAYAANLLGLSEQVPMRSVFLTDGRTRTVRLGKQTIQLRHTTPRYLATAGRISGLVFQALRHRGRHQDHTIAVDVLARRLSDTDKVQLRQDLPYAPQWMAPLIRQIAPPPASHEPIHPSTG